MKRTFKTTVASLGMFAMIALSAAPVAASDFDALGKSRPVIEAEGYSRPVFEAGGHNRPVIEAEGHKKPVAVSSALWVVGGRSKP